jgi:hypothetical protein
MLQGKTFQKSLGLGLSAKRCKTFQG